MMFGVPHWIGSILKFLMVDVEVPFGRSSRVFFDLKRPSLSDSEKCGVCEIWQRPLLKHGAFTTVLNTIFSYKCEVMTPTVRHIPNFRGRLLSLPWKDQVELRLHQKKIMTSLVIPGWVIKPCKQRGKTSRGYNESRPPSTFKRLIPRQKTSQSSQRISWLQRLLHAAIRLKYWIDLILVEKQ